MNLYVSDLDGTLLNYAVKLKSRSERILNRFIKKGVMFTYATARGFHTSRKITANLNLNLPLITMNGAIICEPTTGKPLTNNYISKKSCETASDYFKELSQTPLVYAYINQKSRISYLESKTTWLKNYLSDRIGDKRLRACRSYGELFEGDVFYITLINPQSAPDELKGIFSAANGFSQTDYDDVYTGDYLFEIFKAGVSKSAALKELKKLTGADKTVVFGDNRNDLSMFEAADECYAVKNALPALKAIATGIIPSNEEMGVPKFIEEQETEHFFYIPPEKIHITPDSDRFSKALTDNIHINNGIGTLNEKAIHSGLKNYYSTDIDRETKIGMFYADAINENGIFEIQTASWDRLNKKLECFLDACHVTVVYPFEKRVRNLFINPKSGELLKKTVSNNKSLTQFFFELYRIRGFLTDKNLTVCIAGLEIEKTRFCDENGKCLKRPKGRKTAGHTEKPRKTPVALLDELYLAKPEDYRVFLPNPLPDTFTLKEFQRLSKIGGGSMLLEILGYMGIVEKCGKKGNSFLYKVS